MLTRQWWMQTKPSNFKQHVGPTKPTVMLSCLSACPSSDNPTGKDVIRPTGLRGKSHQAPRPTPSPLASALPSAGASRRQPEQHAGGPGALSAAARHAAPSPPPPDRRQAKASRSPFPSLAPEEGPEPQPAGARRAHLGCRAVTEQSAPHASGPPDGVVPGERGPRGPP